VCSPSFGGRKRTPPPTLDGIPVTGDASTSDTTSRTVLTTPAGTPACAKRASHTSAGALARHDENSLIIRSRCASRPAFVASRSSLASASNPSACTQLAHWESLPTATSKGLSAARKSWYGTRLGCAFPQRVASVPVTRTFCATFTRAARALSASEMKIRRSEIVGARPRQTSADRIAIAASFPAITSAKATPTFIGSPVGSPVTAIHPHSACATKS